ncbi:formyltransferase family protein [Verrucomicrobia bacterium]|nr:formyltransferase family protein [Verrucomicrobiota bacterium]
MKSNEIASVNFLTRSNGIGFETVERLSKYFIDRGYASTIYTNHQQMAAGDVLFILGYLRIVPKDCLEEHSQNFVIHGSDLPLGKGWSPVAWQILEAKQEIVFTLFEATEGLDAGDIYLQRSLSMNGHELFHEWRQMQWDLTSSMVKECIETFDALIPRKQHGEDSFYPRRTHENDLLDATQPLQDQFNLLRVCDPDQYPAWVILKGKKFRVTLSPWE